jgi:hypothetical protein
MESMGNAFSTLLFFFFGLFLPAFYFPLSSMFVTTAPYTQPSHLLLLLLSIHTGHFWGGWLLPLLMNSMERPNHLHFLRLFNAMNKHYQERKGRVT